MHLTRIYGYEHYEHYEHYEYQRPLWPAVKRELFKMNSINWIDRDRKSLVATRSSSLDFYLENYVKYGDDVKQKKKSF